MKAYIYTLIALFSLSVSLAAQDFCEISYGNGYVNQVYYTLNGDQSTVIDPLDWDIAFTTIGQQDAGIHINEANSNSGSDLELYLAPSNDFSANIDPNSLGDPVYNDEKSWEFGAFNNTRDPSNPFDYGWGTYNPMLQTVEATTGYVIKRRDGAYVKMEVCTLAGTVYTVRWANLDGSNEETFTIDKADYPDSPLAYYSLADGEFKAIPNQWDLLFTRYRTPLDAGGGMTIQYLLTGTFSGHGVEVAEADNVNPSNVDHEDYADQYSSELDVLGWDWKDFTGMGWAIPDDRAYFVKTATGEIWKIIFDDFEGSTTGVTVFIKELVDQISSIDDPVVISEVSLSPNPATTESYLSYSTVEGAEVQWRLINNLGAVVASNVQYRQAGFHVETLNLEDLPRGAYFLELQTAGDLVTQKLQRF